MSHFAKIENDIVVQVIVAEQDFIDTQEGEWVQTSYNTRSGKHIDPITGKINSQPPLRGNFACIGMTYDRDKDVFIYKKPFQSWVFDEETAQWEAPTPKPGANYMWDETISSWVVIPID